MTLGFRLFVAVLFLVLLEIYAIASRLGLLLVVVGQLPAIAALMLVLYTWEKEQLKKRAELVENFRFWAYRFFYLTEQTLPNPSQEQIQRLGVHANETAAGLTDTLARCVNMIGSESRLVKRVKALIEKLRIVAQIDLMRGENGENFRSKAKELGPLEMEIGRETSSYIESTFKIRFVAARHLQTITLIAFAICSIVLFLLYLLG